MTKVMSFGVQPADAARSEFVEPTPHGTPMTFLHEGRQYVAFAVGAGRGEQIPALVALALE